MIHSSEGFRCYCGFITSSPDEFEEHVQTGRHFLRMEDPLLLKLAFRRALREWILEVYGP